MAHRSHRKHLKHVHEHAAETPTVDTQHEEPKAATLLDMGRALVSSVTARVKAAPRAVVERMLRRPRALMERFSGMYSAHRAAK